MKNNKNVILCGLGAIGSIYANKFSECLDINFQVLADKVRISKYKVSPITFNGKTLNLKYITPDWDTQAADLIVIATKMSGLDDAVDEIKKFVDDKTIIISLLNGIQSESILANTYNKNNIIPAFYVGDSAIRQGNLISHGGHGTIVFGSFYENDFQVKKLAQIFDTAKIDYTISADIKRDLWKKFILNTAVNSTTALFRLTFGGLERNPRALQFTKDIMKEVIEIAKCEKVNKAETLFDDVLEMLHSMNTDGKTSMLQDIEAGRKTENTIFAKTVLELAVKHKIHTPCCEMIDNIFEIIDYNK